MSDLVGVVAGRERPVRVLNWAGKLPGGVRRQLPLWHLGDVRAYLDAYLHGGRDYRPSLETAPAPITVMVGMRSALYQPAGQEAVAELAPDARLVRFAQANHLLPFEAPVQFNRELRRFLRAA